ncbi:MAG TPA: iron ABC transporter substrate-binding protein, partial [Rubrivivax sp.]|nr:iron ABC transporter substrate-binding protein [Rubrivivax sp.]
MNLDRRQALAATALLAGGAFAQPVADSPELYPGEKALYEAARKEGMVVSFDTGPTWANWAAEFAAFKKRYPGIELVYNDIGSAATVVALDKARNRPQADTAYYFAASGIDAAAKDVVAPFKPVNFDKLPAVFRDPEGRWFT